MVVYHLGSQKELLVNMNMILLRFVAGCHGDRFASRSGPLHEIGAGKFHHDGGLSNGALEGADVD